MKIQTLLIIFITLSLAGQALAQRKETYDNQAFEFLNSTRDLKELVLLDKSSIIRPSCLLELGADTFYTKKEIRLIEKLFKNPPIKKWTKQLLPDLRIFTAAQLKTRQQKGYKIYHAYGAPIFLRNGTYCLFCNANYCGGPCGSGRLRLYYKFADEWVIVKTYCKWIS